jgi:vesicle coat complex subunit
MTSFTYIFFLCREVVEKFPDLRSTITQKLISTLSDIKSGKVFRGVLWILGEYVDSAADISSAMQEIRKVIGEIPILASEQKLLDEAGGDGEAKSPTEDVKAEGGGRPKVLADGTYATETAYSSAGAARLEAVKAAAKPPLRSEFGSPAVCICISSALEYSLTTRRRFLHWCCTICHTYETCSSILRIDER